MRLVKGMLYECLMLSLELYSFRKQDFWQLQRLAGKGISGCTSAAGCFLWHSHTTSATAPALPPFPFPFFFPKQHIILGGELLSTACNGNVLPDTLQQHLSKGALK